MINRLLRRRLQFERQILNQELINLWKKGKRHEEIQYQSRGLNYNNIGGLTTQLPFLTRRSLDIKDSSIIGIFFSYGTNGHPRSTSPAPGA